MTRSIITVELDSYPTIVKHCDHVGGCISWVVGDLFAVNTVYLQGTIDQLRMFAAAIIAAAEVAIEQAQERT